MAYAIWEEHLGTGHTSKSIYPNIKMLIKYIRLNREDREIYRIKEEEFR